MSDTFSPFAQTTVSEKYLRIKRGGNQESWGELAHRVTKHVFGAVEHEDIKPMKSFIRAREFMPAGRYLSNAGRRYHQVQNCVLLRAGDSREGWSSLLQKSSLALMTGAGIGSEYSDVRPEGSPIRGTGGVASGPLSLMQMINECGRGIMQGGSRRAAIWAGLNWVHADCYKFIGIKNWSKEILALKKDNYSFPAPMDMTNVSVGLDDDFFKAMSNPEHPQHVLAGTIYWAALERMLKTGEPGFSVNCGDDSKETLRNACTEITSEDDSDICNLGSINLGRVTGLEHFKRLVAEGTKFLLAGTVYSDVPYPEIDNVRSRNRRLGLGLMGIHEWLLKRGKRYGPDDELAEWLDVYRTVSRDVADRYAEEWGLSRPLKVRSIAPNGTIGIVAETTTGIEPIFCVAYKRRWLKHKTWSYQYVLDPTAKRLIDSGIPAESIEDAYMLAEEPERRVIMQAFMQEYVDHAISSTINLPEWGSEFNNPSRVRDFGNMLLKQLPKLRGITAYPDGARGGQPLTPVKYSTAVKQVGRTFEEAANICSITGRGSCGE